MSTLNQLKKPIETQLDSFQRVFKNSVKSKVPLLDVIMRYLLKAKGKQLRPVIVVYSATLFGQPNEVTYRAASLIELLHTATLVHDDVVDDASRRRGRFSINALWRNKIAVLAGDYLLSRGMLLALKSKDYSILEIVSEAVKEMSEGELLQMEKARKLDIDEVVYYDVIRKKTASLLASCFAAGAASTCNDPELVRRMWQIGELAGMAFQIKDDLFDFQKNNLTGKPSGIDIKEKKMTLPLIYALNKASFLEKRKIINIVKNHNTDENRVSWLMDFVKESGGLAYAEIKMNEFKKQSLDLLCTFPENQARKALEELVVFSIERSK
ncbi:MAG: polyprenyl synthetase [Bacteroidetes bacterium GWF2_41_31]|nr:MAG: polyprenyl synthetase [Bacteroidetes bacterium GWF2_41_31]